MEQSSVGFLKELEQARADIAIWGKILESHRARLRNMLNLQIHDAIRGRLDASDVIQETFTEATQRLPEFIENPAVPFYVWLRSLARQRLAIAHRHHLGVQARDAAREVSIYNRQLPAATSAALAAQLIGNATSPSSAAVAAEHRVRLQTALDELEPIDRDILILRHFEELSNTEAAAVLGLRPTAASNRYIRALERLKSALNRLLDHPSEFLS